MNILIASAGVLPPEPVADFVEILVSSGGRVAVMNVVQSPRSFLDELSAGPWQPFGASPDLSYGDEAGSEADRYVQERGSKIVAPVVAALRGRRIYPESLFIEAEDVAQAIIETADQMGADTIVLGATRRLFDESAWTSISMKVSSGSRVPVLLIPEPTQGSVRDQGRKRRPDRTMGSERSGLAGSA